MSTMFHTPPAVAMLERDVEAAASVGQAAAAAAGLDVNVGKYESAFYVAYGQDGAPTPDSVNIIAIIVSSLVAVVIV